MNYKTLINVLEDGSISVNPNELREALLQIATDKNSDYANKILDAVNSYLKLQGYDEFSSNYSVYLLDALSQEADEIYSDYKGEGLNIQKFLRDSIKEKIAPLN